MPERSAVLRLPVRGVDMVRLLDTLLVCAVTTILVVRTQLWLTNYPQLGGRGLHIAHLLWGGLFMLIGLVILLAFLEPAVRQVGAVSGGIGLGLFLDELGKFVTADNNYFFKPTAAIIYCFFVGFYLVVRHLDRRRLTQQEYLVNAVEQLKEAALGVMDEARRRRALALLGHADHSDPLVPELRRTLESVHVRPTRRSSAVVGAARRLRARVGDLVGRPWFAGAVAAVFVVWAALSLVQVVTLVVLGTVDPGEAEALRLGDEITSDPLDHGDRTFIRSASLLASAVATGFVLAGLRRLGQGRRAAAFLHFERALLVSIFFTQVFAFVHSQFAAVFGLLINLVLFLAVRGILDRELAPHREGG